MGSEAVIFVTMFLSLTAGVHQVEVEVADSDLVARVEIRLDGNTVGVLEQAPWRLDCDFGTELEPHALEAVALDTQGVEIGRARQVVNLPRPDAECVLALYQHGLEGSPHLRIVCRDYLGSSPASVRVTLDNRELQVADPLVVPLPLHDPDSFHFVSTEAVFPDGTVAEAQLAFGGRLRDEVRSELTAVPVVVEGRKAHTPQSLEGLFFVRGEPVPVAAVERADATLIVVEDRNARDALLRDELWANGARLQVSPQGGLKLVDSPGLRESHELLEYGRMARTTCPTPEADGNRVQLVDPIPLPRQAGLREVLLTLFPVSQPFPLSRYAVRWLLVNSGQSEGVGGAQEAVVSATLTESQQRRAPGELGQRLSDALAVAGIEAARRSKPRAVLLVVDADTRDDSLQTAGAVRDFLARLNVPLFVWSTGGGKRRATPWGEAEPITDMRQLMGASDRLQKRLASQRIVWLVGAHLPQEITLAGAARGLHIAR